MDSEEFQRLKEALPKLPDLNWGMFKVIFLVLVAIVGILTSVYTIPAESVGVVMRFGKYSSTTDPGLRMKLPFFIDQAEEVPIRRQLKQEFGFGTAGATNNYQSARGNIQESEKSMVTGDSNVALVEWVVQYHIKDAMHFLFKVRNPDETLRVASESIMREVVGDRTVDEVITFGRQEIEIEAKTKLQALVDKYEMGLGIDLIQLKSVNAPREVQASFNEVESAKQELEQAKNRATGEKLSALKEAQGKADKLILEAEGYATQRINEAEGDVARFNAIFEEYLKAPEVTRQRLYLEAMGETIPKLGRKIILDDEAQQLLPFLQIDPGAKTFNTGRAARQ
ncbi:MAG: FtsH protease activity modulator HflK [Alphaproteobacteria bacterium]